MIDDHSRAYRRAHKLQAIRDLDAKIDRLKALMKPLVWERGKLKMSLKKIDEFANDPNRAKALVQSRGPHSAMLPPMTPEQYKVYRRWRWEYEKPREDALAEALR